MENQDYLLYKINNHNLNQIKMKPYTTEEKKAASKRAFNYIFSLDNVLLDRKFKYDRRFRIGNLANSIVFKKQLTAEQKKEIMEKRKSRARAKAKKVNENILKNPILVDFLKHKHNVKYINDGFIEFYGRNHHAKTPQDHMILKVLKKYFKK